MNDVKAGSKHGTASYCPERGDKQYFRDQEGKYK